MIKIAPIKRTIFFIIKRLDTDSQKSKNKLTIRDILMYNE